MVEDHEEGVKRLEERFKGMLETIEQSYLRKMQGDMHRCAAKCCDNTSYSMERHQNCVDNCSTSLNNAQEFVQSEVSRLQNRWNRCIMECNDRMKDQAGALQSSSSSSSSSALSSRIGKEFESCAGQCINAQCNLIDTVETSLKRVLASGKYNTQI